MKKKIKLSKIEIQSFVTELGHEKLKTLNGGETWGSKVLICESEILEVCLPGTLFSVPFQSCVFICHEISNDGC